MARKNREIKILMGKIRYVHLFSYGKGMLGSIVEREENVKVVKREVMLKLLFTKSSQAFLLY